jgi:hypothetical protein
MSSSLTTLTNQPVATSFRQQCRDVVLTGNEYFRHQPTTHNSTLLNRLRLKFAMLQYTFLSDHDNNYQSREKNYHNYDKVVFEPKLIVKDDFDPIENDNDHPQQQQQRQKRQGVGGMIRRGSSSTSCEMSITDDEESFCRRGQQQQEMSRISKYTEQEEEDSSNDSVGNTSNEDNAAQCSLIVLHNEIMNSSSILAPKHEQSGAIQYHQQALTNVFRKITTTSIYHRFVKLDPSPSDTETSSKAALYLRQQQQYQQSLQQELDEILSAINFSEFQEMEPVMEETFFIFDYDNADDCTEPLTNDRDNEDQTRSIVESNVDVDEQSGTTCPVSVVGLDFTSSTQLSLVDFEDDGNQRLQLDIPPTTGTIHPRSSDCCLLKSSTSSLESSAATKNESDDTEKIHNIIPITTSTSDTGCENQIHVVRWKDEHGQPLEDVLTIKRRQDTTCRIFIALINDSNDSFEYLHCEFQTQERLKVMDLLHQIPKLRKQKFKYQQEIMRRREELYQRNIKSTMEKQEQPVQTDPVHDPMPQISFLPKVDSDTKYTSLCILGKELINMLSIQDYLCVGTDESKFVLRDGIIFFALQDGWCGSKELFLQKAQQTFQNVQFRRGIQRTRIAGRDLQKLKSSDEVEKERNITMQQEILESSKVQECRNGVINRCKVTTSSKDYLDNRQGMENIIGIDQMIDVIADNVVHEDNSWSHQSDSSHSLRITNVDVDQNCGVLVPIPLNAGVHLGLQSSEQCHLDEDYNGDDTEGPLSMSILSISCNSSLDLVRICL